MVYYIHNIIVEKTCIGSKYHKLEVKEPNIKNMNNRIIIGNAGEVDLSDLTINVHIQEAVIPQDVDWKDDTCDIYVKASLIPYKSYIKRELYNTKVMSDTVNPHFENESFSLAINRDDFTILNGTLVFSVWDYNDNYKKQHVGDVTIPIMDIV